MRLRKLTFIASLIALLSALSAQAQVAGNATKHFEKFRLEFDYPADWKITDGGTDESAYVELATADKTSQLIVNWEFGPVLNCEKEGIRKRISQELADRLATQIKSPVTPATAWQKIRIGKLDAEQTQLRGLLGTTPVIADVYSLVVESQFLNLVYLRLANEATGDSAWETIRTTLTVADPPRLPAGKPGAGGGGILNGRAIRLPRPDYPSQAKARHAAGVVIVQVLIDEFGNVIAACAVSGHSTLLKASEQAAREAKFSPTKLSGKPVRVVGLITYNFVAM
ncbi:MAG TPA: energy transducer TonB [Pyrinomonadaceae bacterium]|jgi:TonB family protein|nr:energy transducer TonB [Pyrinomonadaceae bacterium]